MSCLLVAYLGSSALTFAALHVVSGPPASMRRKSSGQVPSIHTPQEDTLIGHRSGHTWLRMVSSAWLWGRGGSGRGSSKFAWENLSPRFWLASPQEKTARCPWALRVPLLTQGALCCLLSFPNTGAGVPPSLKMTCPGTSWLREEQSTKPKL